MKGPLKHSEKQQRNLACSENYSETTNSSHGEGMRKKQKLAEQVATMSKTENQKINKVKDNLHKVAFRSLYNKTIIRFGFCDIQNNQGLVKGYQP